MFRPFAVLVVVLAVMAAGCSSPPATCDEVADESIVLMQDLIDEVEAEVDAAEIQDLLDLMASQEDLPSVEAFQDKAAKLSERAGELGCTQSQLDEAVVARADQLHAETELGDLIIWAVKNGGL